MEKEICNYCRQFDMVAYRFEEGEYEVDGEQYGYCMCDQRKVKKHYNDPCDCHFIPLDDWDTHVRQNKKKIGVCYCAECRCDYTVYIVGEGDAPRRAPQIYLSGFHLHFFDQIVHLPPICIWLSNFEELQKEIDNAKEAATWLKLEDKMYELLFKGGEDLGL